MIVPIEPVQLSVNEIVSAESPDPFDAMRGVLSLSGELARLVADSRRVVLAS